MLGSSANSVRTYVYKLNFPVFLRYVALQSCGEGTGRRNFYYYSIWLHLYPVFVVAHLFVGQLKVTDYDCDRLWFLNR